jgi:hypothetical protein
MKKIFLQSIVVIVGIAMGGAVGGYLTFHRYARKYAMVRAFAWTGVFEAVSENRYDLNSSNAKRDLLYTLDAYRQGVQSSNIDPVMSKALRIKCGLIEARLSVLENEAGNFDRGKSYMSKAQEDLKAVGWVDPSETNILQIVKRQPVSPCGMSSQSAAKTIASVPQKPCG